MNHFAGVTRSLAGLTVLALLVSLPLLALLSSPSGRRWLGERFRTSESILLGIAWLVSAIATSGSLYFSEVVGFTPCLLCWYQRIAMYPMVAVLGIAALLRDRRIWRYTLPLSGIGLLLSIYHAMIELQPALAVGSCGTEVPCTVRLFAVMGFISIPVMAGGAFLLISALMLLLRELERGGFGTSAD